MIELFPDVTTTFKKQTKFLVDLAVKQENILKATKMIKDFSDTCINESEKDFIQFYLHLKALELDLDLGEEDESNSNQWQE